MKRKRVLAAIALVVILAGSVLGTACAGAKGEQGTAGVGIQSIVDNGNGTLTVKLTDGTTYTTDNLTGPRGPKGDTGATGATGATGQQGAKGDTGMAGAGINWRGEWSSSTAYNQNDAVGYQGSSYTSKQASNTNHVPTDSAWWDLWVAKGDQGTQGIQGIQGVQGPPGPNMVVAMLILREDPYDTLWSYNVQMTTMYSDNHCAIKVNGISYYFGNYVTVVNLIGSGPGRTVRTDSANGQLLVYIYDSAGNPVWDAFSLVVFDPSKA